jgi:hypothetical protein
MSTSNSFNFVDTTSSIVIDAVHKFGKLAQGDSLTPYEMALGIRAANRILKSMMVNPKFASSVKTWQRQTRLHVPFCELWYLCVGGEYTDLV